jgi:hypothetical protein
MHLTNPRNLIETPSNASTPLGIPADGKSRTLELGETILDVVPAACDSEAVSGLAMSPGSVEIAAASEQLGGDGEVPALVLFVRAQLEQHAHFRGRSSLFTVELIDETIVMTGCLPSFYLKQLLQEVIKVMPGIDRIDNQVIVVWPNS